MITVWSFLPFVVPNLVMWAAVAVNINRSTDDEFENWDNGLATIKE